MLVQYISQGVGRLEGDKYFDLLIILKIVKNVFSA